MKKTPKKPKTASPHRGRASLRLRGLLTRFSNRWKAGRMARRSFFRTLWRVGWRCGVLLLLCASLTLTLVMTVSTTMVKLTAEGIVDSLLQTLNGNRILSTNVNITLGSTDSITGNSHSLN